MGAECSEKKRCRCQVCSGSNARCSVRLNGVGRAVQGNRSSLGRAHGFGPSRGRARRASDFRWRRPTAGRRPTHLRGRGDRRRCTASSRGSPYTCAIRSFSCGRIRPTASSSATGGRTSQTSTGLWRCRAGRWCQCSRRWCSTRPTTSCTCPTSRASPIFSTSTLERQMTNSAVVMYTSVVQFGRTMSSCLPASTCRLRSSADCSTRPKHTRPAALARLELSAASAA